MVSLRPVLDFSLEFRSKTLKKKNKKWFIKFKYVFLTRYKGLISIHEKEV